MPITNLDGIISGSTPTQEYYKNTAPTVIGRWYSTFYNPGIPGPSTAALSEPTYPKSGSSLTSYPGQIGWINPDPGEFSYLNRFGGCSTQIGRLQMVDRLWHNSMSGSVTSSAGNRIRISSSAWPDRDVNGTINGEQVFIVMECSTLMGAGTPSITMSYVNSDGIGGRRTFFGPIPTAQTSGSMQIVPLQAGDRGVKSIDSWEQSATMTSGIYHLVAYRMLASIDLTVANVGAVQDVFTTGMPRLYDNTVPFIMWLPATTNITTLFGLTHTIQG